MSSAQTKAYVRNTSTQSLQGETDGPSRSEVEYSKDGHFYCSPLVIIRVEDCLFRIPQELLENHSEVFRTMFTLPAGGDGEESEEGRLESKPLYLEGVKKDDFQHLLSVLSALNYEEISSGKIRGKTNLLLSRFPLYHDLSTQNWVSVLRLATMWNMDKVRAQAMRTLEADTSFVMMSRLTLAYELDITSTSWLLPIYRCLVEKEVSISESDEPWLSQDFLKKIAQIREERLKSLLVRFISSDTPRPTCNKCRDGLFKLVAGDIVLSGGAPVWKLHCKKCNTLVALEEVIQSSPALTNVLKDMDAEVDNLIDLYLPTSADD